MSIALTITTVLLIVVTAICIWLASLRERLRDRINQLVNESHTAELQSQEQISSLRAQVQSQRQVSVQIEQAQSQARDMFKAVAADALRASSDQFLQLATKSFEGDQKDALKAMDDRKRAVETLITPIKESLDKYNQSIHEVERARKEAYGSLTKQVDLLKVDQRHLRDETANLVQALRRPDVGGRWGEMQLRRVAELAGMIRHCDFSEQQSVQNESGRQRPDMTVHLPSDRTIVIDAKTPIDAYLGSLDATDDAQRRTWLDRHVANIESKVKDLANKQYQAQFERSPDFVVLFIPGESFLYAAAQLKPKLVESAMEKGILIATPTTLISLLKTVALGWREQQIADGAKKISALGRQLHERLTIAAEHIDRVGNSLRAAVDHYNKFVGSFEMRVLTTARKFDDLGADSTKQLPSQITQVDISPRKLKGIETTTDKKR